MRKKNKNILILLLNICLSNLFAQSPSYFKIDTDNGLPTNEVYSILQDKKGFVWIGCDAGIYKSDGIKFYKYSNPFQKTKSMSGLCSSKTGRIYSHTFNGQIFYIENDSLNYLSSWNGEKISNMICDDDYNLWVSGASGMNCYNEKTKKWSTFIDFNLDGKVDQELFTNSCRKNNRNQISFICPKGIALIENKKLSITPFLFDSKNVSSEFIIENTQETTWMFKNRGGDIYKIEKNQVLKYSSEFLTKNLNNARINNILDLKDGLLWISTYSGIIAYNLDTQNGIMFYPNLAFSSVIIDNDKNYWLTTLNDGIIKITDMQFKVWNNNFSNQISSNKINKVAGNFPLIYFSNSSGQIAYLNAQSNTMSTFDLAIKANIHNLYFSKPSNSLYFNALNTLYSFKNNKISILNDRIPPVKDFCEFNKKYILATSRGTFIYKDFKQNNSLDTLTNSWSRSIAIDSIKKHVWIATNDGLLKFKQVGDKLKNEQKFLKGIQLLSANYSHENQTLYLLTFNGYIVKINAQNTLDTLNLLPDDVQGNQIKAHQNSVYIATNKGLWKIDDDKATWEILNKSTGLASNEINAFDIINNNLWLATANGLQTIPLYYKINKSLADVFLKSISVDGKRVFNLKKLNLKYNNSITLKLETNAYSSNGNYKYAYRFSNSDSNWIMLPGSIDQLEIRNLPIGNFLLEIKLIDYLSRNSKNKITLSGYVSAPFWQQWWFNLILLALVLFSAFILFKNRIKKLRKKQISELKKVRLENELRLSQQSALKAQMNPHFIFNVLNSIKGYIYENDKKNATLYLSSFSELVRKILHNSAVSEVKLDEEIEILKLYIDLEAMLLQEDFSYSIIIDEKTENKTIKIPALLIQPFVENSFKHGLRHKKGTKKLTIEINYNEHKNCLLVTIEDNGIGRTAANQFNQSATKTHTSFASDATAKRIELLNFSRKDIVNVSIIDLVADDNSALGTKVLLTLALNE